MSKTRKGCFVTVGATASFDRLIAEILSPKFLQSLTTAGYTHLVVQYGKTGAKVFSSYLQKAKQELGDGFQLLVEGFDFKMGDFAETVHSVTGGDQKGLLIAHAGTGSLMDGIALQIPTILVPNPALLNNHQAELALQFEKAGYCTYGHLGDLHSAIVNAESLQSSKAALSNSKSSVWTVVDQEMGFTDRYLD